MDSLRNLLESLKGFGSWGSAWLRQETTRQKEAQRYLTAGDYVAAESALVGALEEAETNKDSDSSKLRLMLQLAEVQRKQAAVPAADPEGEWIRAAEESARRAVELAAQSHDSEGYVDSLWIFAQILCDQDRWDAAEKVLLEANRLAESLPRPKTPAVIERTHLLGVAIHKQGRCAEAADTLNQALNLGKAAFGEHSLEYANLLSATGKLFRAQGDHEHAQELLRAAQRTHRAELGETSREVFDDLLHIGGSLEDQGDLEAAAAQFEAALTIKQRQLGVSHLEPMAEMQYSLANLYLGWDNGARAKELLIECIGTFRRSGGARLAVCYETLAQVEEAAGHHSVALIELEKAGKVWEKCGPDRAVELIHNLEYRANLLEDLRNPKQAAWLRQRAGKLRETAGLVSLDEVPEPEHV